MSDEQQPKLPPPPPPPPAPGTPVKTRINHSDEDGVITRADGILAKRQRPFVTPPPRANDAEYMQFYRERDLTAEDWQKVYLAFAKTGDHKKIAKEVGLSTDKVKLIVEYGIRRLGLPSIREATTDKQTVNKRVEAIVGEEQAALVAKLQEGDQSELELQHLKDVREAVTNRAIRETASAQATLITSVHVNDVALGYATKILQSLADGESDFLVPEHITPGFLETLSKAINNLANATSKAIEASRLTAGEPTQNIALHVASFTTAMTREELVAYAKHGQIPSHLRVRGGSRDSVESRKPIGIEAKATKVLDE